MSTSPSPYPNHGQPAQQASRTPQNIVLWIAIGLVSIALYFANSMHYELTASDNRVNGLDAEQAIERLPAFAVR